MKISSTCEQIVVDGVLPSAVWFDVVTVPCLPATAALRPPIPGGDRHCARDVVVLLRPVADSAQLTDQERQSDKHNKNQQ
jgi:hypothetical protein